MWIHKYIGRNTHVCMCVRERMRVCVFMPTCIYIHACICTQTHTHMHICIAVHPHTLKKPVLSAASSSLFAAFAVAAAAAAAADAAGAQQNRVLKTAKVAFLLFFSARPEAAEQSFHSNPLPYTCRMQHDFPWWYNRAHIISYDVARKSKQCNTKCIPETDSPQHCTHNRYPTRAYLHRVIGRAHECTLACRVYQTSTNKLSRIWWNRLSRRGLSQEKLGGKNATFCLGVDLTFGIAAGA